MNLEIPQDEINEADHLPGARSRVLQVLGYLLRSYGVRSSCVRNGPHMLVQLTPFDVNNLQGL